MDAVEASLRRLQTDHIDLYQIQGNDPVASIEETLPSNRERGRVRGRGPAARDGVVGLKRVEAGKILALRDPEGFGNLPRLPIGDAKVAHLALRDERVERTGRATGPKTVGLFGMIFISLAGRSTQQSNLDRSLNKPVRESAHSISEPRPRMSVTAHSLPPAFARR